MEVETAAGTVEIKHFSGKMESGDQTAGQRLGIDFFQRYAAACHHCLAPAVGTVDVNFVRGQRPDQLFPADGIEFRGLGVDG